MKTHYLSTSEGKIHTQTTGKLDGQKPILLGIHGTMASLEYFRELIPYLNSTLDIITVDMLGHGLSDLPRSDQFSIDLEASSLWEAIDQLSITTPLILCGFSMGGSVAIRMAELRPAQVRSLVLLSTSNTNKYVDLGPIVKLLSVPILGSLIKFGINHASVPKKAPNVFAPDFDLATMQDPTLIMRSAQRMTRHAIIETKKMGPHYIDEKSLDLRLTELALPTLIIFGDQDRIPGSEGIQHAKQDYEKSSNVEFHLYKGAGHAVMIEKPAEVATAVNTFLHLKI